MRTTARRRGCRGQGGFTLVELLIVIVVLGVLSGITILAVGQFSDDAKSNSCEVDKTRLETAVSAYKASHDMNPGSLVEMTTTDPSFLDNEDVVDSTLVRDSYTLTYDPATGAVNDCTAAIAAGGGNPSPVPTTTATATASATPTATPTPTPTGSASAIPPVITSCDPPSIRRNGTRTFEIVGTGFDADASVGLSGTGVTSVTVTSRTVTKLTVSVELTNQAGTNSRDVTVTNESAGTSDIEIGCLSVTASN